MVFLKEWCPTAIISWSVAVYQSIRGTPLLRRLRRLGLLRACRACSISCQTHSQARYSLIELNEAIAYSF